MSPPPHHRYSYASDFNKQHLVMRKKGRSRKNLAKLPVDCPCFYMFPDIWCCQGTQYQ